MERRRRWLASLLALVLAVGLLPTAAWASGEVDNSVEDTEQITETEVETGSTAAEFLSDNTAVDSTDNITRAQMAEMVYEHESLQTDIDSMAYGGSAPNFTDITVSEGVTPDQHDAIIALYKAQIINGTSETTFAPGGQVTRNEFAVVLWRATGCRSNNTAMEQTLSDVALWAEAAVNCFFGAGLVKGDTSNDFRGSVPITVAEVNAFLTAYQTNRETFIANTKEGATSRAAMTVEFYHEFQSQLSSLLVTRQWESDGPFTDLFGCTDEQIEAIRFFYLRGIIDGTTETTFHPLTPVTNFMVATLLQRCAEAPESLTTTPDTQSVSLLNVMPLSENEGNLGAAFQFLIDNGADENSVRAADANENAPALTSDLTSWIGGLTPGRPMITINGDTVTITADTDADIYYTTDGNPPTSGSTPYSSTFRLTASATVRAVAVKNNLVSDVAQAPYTAPVLTITPSPTSLTGGGTVTFTVTNAPTDAAVSVTCSDSSIAVSGSGTAWTAALPNADATYTFTVAAGTATDTCTVTVTRRSTSSSGSSSSSSNTTTSTERNPDGSTTTTTTNKTTGTVTETTRYPDGSREVVETKRDGTVTTTSTDADGNQTRVVESPDGSMETAVDNADGTASVTTEDPDGRVTVEAVLPASAVNNAGGEAVALPMPAVRAERDRGDAPTVTVDLPRGASVPVEIPVENAAVSTVALLVHADGTEEIVKTSLATEDGVTVSLSDGDTVKIVDNGKTFYDVPGSHWGAEAIDFVTSRELFGGTSAVTFEPERSMNRGMLVTVLYRLENEPNVWGGGSYTDVPEGMYYSSAVAWADGNGIVTGYAGAAFAPGRDITREEMAVVLYRYARYKGLDVTASADLGRYTDADSISAYAQEAMAWATAYGLVTADTTGALTPKGYATRAQVATILQRFLYLMDG